MDSQSAWNVRKKTYCVGDGRQLTYVHKKGSGTSFLLIHGFTDSSRSYSLLTPHLSGANIVIPDLIGHGQSSRPQDGYELDTLSEDIAQFIRSTFEFPPIVVGHSLGAMIALRLAVRHPILVKAIVLISGTLLPSLPQNDPLKMWVRNAIDPILPTDHFFETWHHCIGQVDLDFLHHTRNEAANLPVRVWKKLIEELDSIDLRSDAKTLRAPALMISGDADPLFGAGHTSKLEKAIRPIRHEQFRQCGHNPHWEYPSKVATHLWAFADSLKALE